MAREGRLVEDDDCLSSFRNLSEASISLGACCFLLWETRDKSMVGGAGPFFFWKMGELYDKKAWVGG